jgi:putative ABC transport system permease protein
MLQKIGVGLGILALEVIVLTAVQSGGGPFAIAMQILLRLFLLTVGIAVLGIIVLVLVATPLSLISLASAVLPVKKVPLVYNLRNLQSRWRTTFVTGLAFTVVIALLVVMLAFVNGMNRLTETSGQPGNVMILSDGATDEAFSSLPGSMSVQLLPSELQAYVAQDEEGNYLAVKEVYVIVNQEISGADDPARRKRRFVQLRGIDDPLIAAKVHAITLRAGEWFSQGGVRTLPDATTAYEVVLGDGVARTFGADRGKDSLEPGDVLQIGPRTWYVTGVMDPQGSTFGSEIWAKDNYVGETFGRVNAYSTFVVRTANEQLAQQASVLLKQYRSDRALQAIPEKEYYAKLNQTNQQFLYAIIFVAVIMAIGGVLGVMNTMFAAISQRTKDIGVLRLLGYTRWQILKSFLMESMVIAFIGGALGCLLGSMADGWTATSIVSSGQGGGGKSVVLRLIVDGRIIATGFLFTFLMGAVGGLIPSISAMRLKPLESLR